MEESRIMKEKTCFRETLFESHKNHVKTGFDTIQKRGADGWELISVTPVSTDFRYPGQPHKILFTFKRPIN